jgi:hypothetical protein
VGNRAAKLHVPKLAIKLLRKTSATEEITNDLTYKKKPPESGGSSEKNVI